jgi:Family of unknown function (DUF6228)
MMIMMNEFSIKSSDSDLALVFSDIHSDYFNVSIKSIRISATCKVWGYTDAHGFAGLLELLAAQTQPWQGKETWISLEGTVELSITCSNLGQLTFTITLSNNRCAEPWEMTTELRQEMGQLPHLARSARSFFGPAPD